MKTIHSIPAHPCIATYCIFSASLGYHAVWLLRLFPLLFANYSTVQGKHDREVA